MTDMALPSTRRAAGSEATAIEQTRAAEQVRAAVFLAQQFPRDPRAAMRRIVEVVEVREIADRAFFRYPRGTDDDGNPKYLTGPSIVLAVAMAQEWGNIDYGIMELARYSDRSEMLSYAWDLERNVRVTAGFLVPHARDTKRGQRQLTDLRDIYENNANNGARRLRACIERVIPLPVRLRAEAAARAALERGDGKPIGQRRDDAVAGFRRLGIDEPRMVAKLGRPVHDWDAQDLADLAVIFSSIERGEVRAEEEFPAPPRPGVTGADIEAQAAARATDAEREAMLSDAGPQTAEQKTQRRDAAGRRTALHAALTPYGLQKPDRRDDKLAALTAIVDRPIQSSNDLSNDEVRVVLEFLDALAQGNPEKSERELAVAEQITRGRELLTAQNTRPQPPAGNTDA